MADIELVIKIPRKIYKAICDKNALGCDISDIKNIIRNGTPLPKGHGRLIDADALGEKEECLEANRRIKDLMEGGLSMKRLKVTYIGDEEFQINVELPDEIVQSYSKEAIAMALMCTVDNWVNERMVDLNEKKRLFSEKTIR